MPTGRVMVAAAMLCALAGCAPGNSSTRGRLPTSGSTLWLLVGDVEEPDEGPPALFAGAVSDETRRLNYYGTGTTSCGSSWRIHTSRGLSNGKI